MKVSYKKIKITSRETKLIRAYFLANGYHSLVTYIDKFGIDALGELMKCCKKVRTVEGSYICRAKREGVL